MRILITGVGGPTPRSFAISLKKYSFYKRFELFGTDINPLAVGLYQNELFNATFVVPSASHPDYWPAMRELIAENGIELAVILPEMEVMEWSRVKEAGGLPCKALLPDYSMATLLVDKAKMTDILDDMNLVPKSVAFHRDLKDFSEVFAKLGENFWVRSTKGTSGLGSLRVEDENALRNWISINPGVEEFLASQFLPGRNLACKMLYFNGKLLRTACAERVNYIMAKVAPSGITGNTSFGRLLNEPALVDTAISAMDRLFEHTGAARHGFFTVDFKEDAAGKPYITEINVRHVAFTQCFSAGGANFAEDTVRLLDNDPDFDLDYRMYEFEKGLIFLRDVDSLPILMKESELIAKR